jgi:hypothetical protein
LSIGEVVGDFEINATRNFLIVNLSVSKDRYMDANSVLGPIMCASGGHPVLLTGGGNEVSVHIIVADKISLAYVNVVNIILVFYVFSRSYCVLFLLDFMSIVSS